MTGKTIVYLPNWLGDMVMATPFLKSLRTSFKGEIWAIGKTKSISLYSGMNLFNRFIPYDGKDVISFFNIVSTLKEIKFDMGLILPHSMRSALLFYLGGVKKRIGYDRNKRGIMLTVKVKGGSYIESTVEHYLRILDTLNIERRETNPVLTVTEDEEHKYNERFGYAKERYVAFIPGAQYGPSKRWPISNFIKLADLICEKMGLKIYILPGKEETGLSEEIKHHVKDKNRVEIRHLDIGELKVCLSKAVAVVSNDTGPRHISAALSVPTFVIFGPMDERYTDYPSTCTYKFIRNIPCRPCNKKVCNKNLECLLEITPEDVYKKMEEIIGREKV
ncbi:MAG TPA: lipopolysaccharide heptosyltransferase II [Syntrophorhabdaceae bacterium]|nr:lipopolysaccharide heptosyltransferase II [Syntrophorhabdaceae bacterium]HPP05841.1 lipopolysaccharide heptosyltransferase II [Syntrophorhabdaceae bacterium]